VTPECRPSGRSRVMAAPARRGHRVVGSSQSIRRRLATRPRRARAGSRSARARPRRRRRSPFRPRRADGGGYDVSLSAGPARRSAEAGRTGRLVVRLAYQHLAERAIYEVWRLSRPTTRQAAGDGRSADPGRRAERAPDAAHPRPARADEPPRLRASPNQSIPFTRAGVLEALGTSSCWCTRSRSHARDGGGSRTTAPSSISPTA
jgi:hypothetical protein